MATVWWSLTFLVSIAFSQSQVAEPGCSANYAYIYVESALSTISKTITSERVNYAPYTYTQTVPRRKLVSFAENELMSDTSNNPCDISTWTTVPSYYDNAIVMLEYSSHFAGVCSPQQWTLNLQTYNTNIQALLISNNADLFNVYPLPGDASLASPTIPTRMISQSSAANILNILNITGTSKEDVFVSISCFNTTSSPIICVVDDSLIGSDVELDGEFQKQADIFMNDHPVWFKEGMNSVWADYYIWLSVDHWRWVIGTNYNDDTSVIAECLAPDIDDPTQCGPAWYRNGAPIAHLRSTDGVCDLGDTYVCVDSGSMFFDEFFAGRYRQVHDATAVWLSDETLYDAFLSIQYVNKSFASGYSFVFSYAANGGVYAFCPISESQPSAELALSPWDCNANWYVVVHNPVTNAYQWYNDPLMDVDECNHPLVSTASPTPISYPKYLCFMDDTYKYSLYQSYYGVYVLDNSTTYDQRFIYRNQRLSANMNSKDWYILWYEEKDAFIINEEIPQITFTSTFGAICRDDVDTADQCSACWEFYQGLQDEINCNAKVKTILTNNEADCMTQAVDNIAPNYSDDVTLCFYSSANSDPLTHKYSGKWKLETRGYYGGRVYWYQEFANTVTSYMYYDATWRYWVIHSHFTSDETQFDLRCLHWDEFEPFNCNEWYTIDGSVVTMDRQCSVSPTVSPTPHPTSQCIEYNKYVYVESAAFTNQILQSQEVNFAPYKSSTFFQVKLVLFEPLTDTTGNPCDSSTFAQPASYYDNSVVMVRYSSFYESLCSPQEWTLRLENYANVIGVIVANDRDFTHTYSLAGDSSLDAPLIATRMISQMAATLLTYAMQQQDDVFVTFGCFDDDISYPSTVCLVDTTLAGDHVYLDGEYQRQEILINDHPIWLKTGHEGLWRDIYMFLDVDSSSSGDASWKWAIGTDYNDRDSIIAVCDLNGQHIDHPALCDLDWSIDGELVSNISTKGTQCALGDNYVCVESSSGGFFETYFAGSYRQTHSGVPLWLLESEYLDAHIRIGSLSWPEMFGENSNSRYVFAFMVNQTDLYAFCVIGETYPSKADALAPYECNTDWYVISYDETNGYQWVIDLAFDIDECSHPNVSITPEVISYPSLLCLRSDTSDYSHFQGHYGVYALDSTQTFDDRFVYKNQRLDGMTGNEWYMLWFEEKDAWAINEMIPGETIVRAMDGICREDVHTPDLCVNECWQFYQGSAMEDMCDVKAVVTSSDLESDCIGALPVNNIIHYTKEISLCFNDGSSSNDWDMPYSGKWYLEESETYGGRAYWYKTDNNDASLPLGINKQYYMYYDQYLRFWILDRILGTGNGGDYLHYYCLHWDEFEPFNCTEWFSSISYKLNKLSMNSKDCFSSAPTQLPTPSPTMDCDARNAWIYAETENYVYAEETLTSIYTNFAPYVYTTFNKAELVIFENDRVMEQHYSNPCDYNTWQEYPSFYENKVVLIKHNEFIASLCLVELWTLNLESYGNGKIKAVLIANDADLNHVYPLAGISDPLSQRADPITPTRMISQFAGIGIQSAIEQGEHVSISFGCFDDVNGIDYPAIICLIDSSIMGKHAYLDGEYQRQTDIIKNEHPVWMKNGFEGIWKNIYMWLDIDQTVNGYSSWKWVIGTDYTRTHSVIAECLVHDEIDHPALCDGNWFINDRLEGNITTSDTICELGDDYICVESAEGGLFDTYFDGQYRQIHSGVPLWFLEDSYLDAYITIGQMTFPPLFENEYVFAFALNQSQIFAFCPIGKEEPSREVALAPQDCNKNWYKLEILSTGYTWVIDYAFDIDECAYKLLPTQTPQYIEYPEILCMSDPTNADSRYQGHYGVYLLDKTQTYDGKYVYYNQRLAANGNADEWYMLWYDEKDAWVLNEMVPDITVVRDNEAICREEVFSPDLCSACWEFSDTVGNYETNCNVQVSVTGSATESDCMRLPVNNMMPNEYASSVVLKFDDGSTDIDANAYSGVWRLSTQAKYGNRVYWFKYFASGITNIEYYMFYDESYRYWVIDRQLGSADKMSWHLYCINWSEFEPFKCDVWYTNTVGFSMQMDASYQLPTTTTATTTSSTTAINGEDGRDTSSAFNVLPWIVCSIGFVALCASLVVFYCRRKKKQRFMFQDVSKDGVFKTVYGVNYTETEDLNVIQMENVGIATRTGTKGKGEIIAMKDDEEDYDDDDVVSHRIIDYEGTYTDTNPLNKNTNNKKPKNWVKFEE